MIIIRISGGLGNQMFQYALGRVLSLKNKTELKLDTHFYDLKTEKDRTFSLHNYNIKGSISLEQDFKKINIPHSSQNSLLSKFLRKLSNKIILENNFIFNPKILEIKNNCYLSGVWQSEKYFKGFEEIIKKDFTLKNKPSLETENWLKKISEGNSVSIHIRRGDYINNQKTNTLHGILNMDYYKKAIDFINSKTTSPVFFVFSDDIEWAKQNLKINHQTFFVSNANILDYEEIIIMSKCRHNIIANSTFSWWGAWLNENNAKIVITPKEWFKSKIIDTKDLIPENWLKI